MGTQVKIRDITVDVLLKDIKNVHLSVYPPAGRVRISAPLRMSLDTIRVFAISKLDWIRRQQEKLRRQDRETLREYLDRESHYVWGRRYTLVIVESDQAPSVELKHSQMILRVRPKADRKKKQAILEEWYRQQLRRAVPPLIEKWEPLLVVGVERFSLQRMKTRWGSCNPATRNIRLNTDLARKPRECLEYLVVHEMVHLLEPAHSPRFVAIMDGLMPQWRFFRSQLNQLPVRHEEWVY